MAGLIKRNQIDGLVQMKATLDAIESSYPANKVTTTVVKTPASEGGAPVYYTGQELLAELKANLDSVIGGGSDGDSLPNLKRLINNLGAELNGGTFTDDDGSTSDKLGFKNKEINDVVRIEFNLASGTTATEKIASGESSKITTEITSGQTLKAYTLNGSPIVGAGGAEVSFDFDSKTFSAAPYVLDIDATKVAGGVDSTTGETIPAQAVYTAFTGDFKVFPVGTWTLETLPATALLDNNEMQLIAYDQALQKVIIQLATDKNLIDRITEAVGETAIEDAVKSATATIDSRLDVLEGNGSDPLAASVKLNQLDGTAETAVGADDAEEITASTKVYTKNKSDELLKAITDDIGLANATANYDANQNIASGTVRSEINALKERYVDKTKLVTSIKSSVMSQDEKQTDDQNTINETALVEKFAALDSKDAQLTNQLNTFIDTTAPATYVAQTQVTDTFTKITKDAGTGTYTDTYTDAAHKEVVGKKLFNEQISEIKDNLGAGTNAAYQRAGIQVAEPVTADATKGITAKNGETAAHVDNGVAVANIPVYSKEAVDNKLANEAEERLFVDAAIDAKTYDWDKIEGYDGTAKTASITATDFNATTGASSTTTTTRTTLDAGTAENISENTPVLSKQEAQAELAATKAELEAVHAADKTETLNRIAYGSAIAQRHLGIEVARLTAESGDPLAPAGNGEEAVTATADGAITALDKKTADWANIEVSAGYSAIIDGNNTIAAAVGAEAAASASTKFTSKQYVDDKVTSSVATLQVTIASNNRAMDARVDAIEAVTAATERIVPVDTAGVETITVAHTPISTAELEVLVNGVSYFLDDGVFTIAGDTITWDGQAAGFTLGQVLDSGEKVTVRYSWNDTTKVTPIA